MTATQQKVKDMLHRLKQFLIDHAAALAQIPQSAAARQLDELLSGMSHSAEVAATGRAMVAGEVARTRALRRALRVNHMQQIAAIARAELPHIPEFEALLLPHVKANTARLVLSARAMATVARQHAEVFLAHQLPADFADQLVAAADALEASVQKRAMDSRDVAGARQNIAAVRSRAQHVVRVLNAQITPLLADDPTLLGQWMYTKRVGINGGSTAVEAVPGQAATATPSGTTATAPVAVVGPQQAAQAA